MKHVSIGGARIDYPIGIYINTAYNFINKVVAILNDVNYFDDIIKNEKKIVLWCRGSSGAILASLFSTAIIKKYNYSEIFINHIKKKGEKSHSDSVYMYNEDCIYIIIDDFIESGETIINILDEHFKYCPDTDVDIIVQSMSSACNPWILVDYYDHIDTIVTNNDTFEAMSRYV